MSNKHRGAPEAPKASSAQVKPTELAGTPSVVENASAPPGDSAVTEGAPEAPKASSVVDGASSLELESLAAADTVLGSVSELVRHDDEDKPQCPKCTFERPCSVECFVAAGFLAENYEKRFGRKGLTLPADGVTRTVDLSGESPKLVDPSRNGKPLPEGAVMVRALRGVVVRVQHRNAGDRFWLLKSRLEDDSNPLSEYADEFAERGDVELL